MSSVETARTFDWDTFTRRYWNRRPVLYKGTRAVPFGAAAVFEAAVQGANGPTSEAQLTIERMQQLRPGTWLPRQADRSWEGYQARVARGLGARRYALIVPRLHAHGYRVWEAERAFFSELWRRVGLPLSGAITTLFHGSYEHSPVGVHQDRFTTFLFALEGRKRMRFWPRRPWRAPVTTVLDYRPYLKGSFVAEVEPGDILYWPSAYYHVGESAGREVATSVNVGIPREEHRLAYSVDDALGGLPGPTGGPLAHGALRPEVAWLPPPLPAALPPALSGRRFRGLGDLRATRLRIQELWLRRLSAAGFEPVPAPAPRRRLRDADHVRGEPGFPIRLERRGMAGWVCAAGGHAVPGTGSPRLAARLCESLSSGREASVAALLEPFRASGPGGAPGELQATRTGMRLLLERLESFRAISRVGARRKPWL